MEENMYINKIVTYALNVSYFKVGAFYVVIYPDGAKALTVCHTANGAEGVRLLVIKLISGESCYHKGAGDLISVDNKNIKEFADIQRYTLVDCNSGNVHDDISLTLMYN